MTSLNDGKKKCTICQTIKSTSEFYKWNKTKDGFMSRCKTCHCIKQKEHRKNPKTKYNNYNREARQKAKQLAIEYKGNKCHDCLITFPSVVYDFHHLNPNEKEFTISNILGRKFENYKEELDKCILLCANCHRLRHYTTISESEGETVATDTTRQDS